MRTRIAFAAVLIACACAIAARSVESNRGKTSASADSVAQIHAVLVAQTEAWNRADVDAFMNGYWKSESTLFVGAGGILRGWQAVLERYRRSYPDRRAMGHLTFSDLEVHLECADAALVIGEFHLQREHDHPSGVFTLDFRRFPEGWRIVADHTTAFPSP
ncbi:MAG TPA: AtzH-like domain-containing protein [Candidatus Cybelea sp.]|nr:AtzH-like domain-containing protein [Candidatus Cybelea sp.]